MRRSSAQLDRLSIPQPAFIPQPERDYFPDGPIPIRGQRSQPAPQTADHPRLIITPDHGCDLDVSEAVTAAIAFQIWKARGGDSVSNWLEAEDQVMRLARRQKNRRPARAGS
jgi:hypothetical protein